MLIDFLWLSIIFLGDIFLEYLFLIFKYYFGFKNLVFFICVVFYELFLYSLFKFIFLIVGGFLIVKKIFKRNNNFVKVLLVVLFV